MDEGFMDGVAAVEAHTQTPWRVQPAQAALDEPPLFAQTTAVGRAASGQAGADAAPPQFLTVRLRVVAPVAQHLLWTMARAPSSALHFGHSVQKRQQLGDVVSVGAGDAHGQRNARSFAQEVVLGAGAGTVGRVGADALAFFSLLEETPTARTVEESTNARDQSKASP